MGFHNNPQDFLKNIGILPDVLIDIIYSYVPKSVTTFLTKINYLENHHLIKQYINKKNIENYIRAMVRQDNDFVFKQLLVENYQRWLSMTKYYHQLCIYTNYTTFIESYSIENKSIKCRTILRQLFEEQGLSKNQHKKNVVKYIRWKT